jgi:transposase
MAQIQNLCTLVGTKPPATMNKYFTKLIMYHEIQKMDREGHSILAISEHLVMNRRTVRRYLSMSEADFDRFMERQSARKRDLSPYEGFIKSRLELYSDTSAAQMHDWLKEHHVDFPVKSAKTIFNFVAYVRMKYNLPKEKPVRVFEVVVELPYGQQAQVDFGEYNMRSNSGKRVKVYFFTLVLSRSRFKYVWFVDKPFTSELAILGHEKAFAFIDGIPEELVYDQDKVFIVSENHGDIILTDGFRAYTRERSFKLHFCRKSDPQSKGKVENVVKYVKQNFLYNRPFEDIETLNAEALAWLGRTANMMAHNGTKKVPEDELTIERPFLSPFTPLTIKPPHTPYTVRKDNTISWKGNFYTLPLGTYKGRGSLVMVVIENDCLLISSAEGTELCRHPISSAKGQKIKNTDHTRDKRSAIEEMITDLCQKFENPDRARQFLDRVRLAKGRYIRDQILILRPVIENTPALILSAALDYCCDHNIAGTADFKAVVAQMSKPEVKLEGDKTLQMNPLNGSAPDVALTQVAQSSIDDYQAIMQTNAL